MQRKLEPTLLNPISLLGAIIAVFSLVIILVLLALGASGTIANPYTGILTFMLGPGALALGLILIPFGAMRQRRRLARLGVIAKTFPVMDLNESRQRRGIAVFVGVTGFIMSLMAATTYGAAEYMETREFCGAVCHRVMEPQGAAYEASPHARVKCVSCHIGPGAPWLVKAKISGIRQVFNYTFDSYPRPLPVPIKDLRPSRDTCEQCHWPARFYGDEFRSYTRYAEDEQNTARSQPMVFRVGGSELGYGIHWHTTAKVWYLPLNEARSEIGWVRVEKPDGTVDEFVLPEKRGEVTPERIREDERFMDCMDCHNRAAHHFGPMEDEVDRALARGSMNPEIPFLKQQVMKAIGNATAKTTEQQYQATLRRIEDIEGYYRTQQPAAYARLGAEIRQSVAELKEIYRRTVFPDMNVGPGSYPDWVGHEGCMRCHGKLTGVSDAVAGKTIGANCLTCHFPAPSVPSAPVLATGRAAQVSASPILPAAIPHPTQGRESCGNCHSVGGPGVGATGGLGIPENHRGRTSETCLACHALAQSATQQAATAPAPAAVAPPAAPAPPIAAPAAQAPATAPAPPAPSGPAAIPHQTQGREQCSMCHTTAGPGVGATGGTGTPADHQGRPDAACAACHKTG